MHVGRCTVYWILCLVDLGSVALNLESKEFVLLILMVIWTEGLYNLNEDRFSWSYCWWKVRNKVFIVLLLNTYHKTIPRVMTSSALLTSSSAQVYDWLEDMQLALPGFAYVDSGVVSLISSMLTRPMVIVATTWISTATADSCSWVVILLTIFFLLFAWCL